MLLSSLALVFFLSFSCFALGTLKALPCYFYLLSWESGFPVHSTLVNACDCPRLKVDDSADLAVALPDAGIVEA